MSRVKDGVKVAVVALAFVFAPGVGQAEQEGATEVRSTEYWRTASPMTVDIGAGLAMYNGNTGWTINFGFLNRISDDSPLYVGADLGLNFWNASTAGGTNETSATGVQLLPTIVYGLGVPALRGVYPYIGLSIGPNVYVERNTVGGTTSSSTRVFFEGLVRPGVRINLARSFSLNIEPKFGLLRSDFIFLPQANLVVAL